MFKNKFRVITAVAATVGFFNLRAQWSGGKEGFFIEVNFNPYFPYAKKGDFARVMRKRNLSLEWEPPHGLSAIIAPGDLSLQPPSYSSLTWKKQLKQFQPTSILKVGDRV